MNPARRHPCLSRQRQSGVIAILILFIVAVVAISFLVSSLKSSSSQTERDKITAAALAQAKAALIGYAAGVNLKSGAARPGDLPCPDTNDDGQAESSCGNATGTTGQTSSSVCAYVDDARVMQPLRRAPVTA